MVKKLSREETLLADKSLIIPAGQNIPEWMFRVKAHGAASFNLTDAELDALIARVRSARAAGSLKCGFQGRMLADVDPQALAA